MINLGVQDATIVGTSVYTKENGTVDISVKLEFGPNEYMTAHIYVTEKSKHMARAALKKCGFDPDTQDIFDLDAAQSPLIGNGVKVDVFDDEYQGKTRRKVEIVIEKKKPDANAMKKASLMLREAKSADEQAEEAVQNIIEGFPQTGKKKVEDPF